MSLSIEVQQQIVQINNHFISVQEMTEDNNLDNNDDGSINDDDYDDINNLMITY